MIQKAPHQKSFHRTNREPQENREIKVYGLNACLSLWQVRAASIIRVYVTKERLGICGALLKWCAQHKKAYHVLEPSEVEKVAGSVHHEGIVILALEKPFMSEKALVSALSQKHKKNNPLLYLDGVKNPHNIGSILRVAAHFGVPYTLGRSGELPRLTPAAIRVAEGGSEHVTLASLEHHEETLLELGRLGWPLVATSSHEGLSLYEAKLPSQCIFALGNEVSGMSPKLLKSAAMVVKIPGTGLVESLNVAACASILLAEHWRQHQGIHI